MDRDCMGLLPKVCQVLSDPGRCLSDDTTLEKLLDWFFELTRAGKAGYLLETCPCLTELISRIIHDTASDPSLLSFALKLTGLLGAFKDSFILLQDHSILGLAYNQQRWQGAGLWEDPCVRIGWIQGLRNLLQHPMALCFLVERELTKPLLELQTDSSLFVASAANQLLSHILVFFQPCSSKGVHDVNEKEKQEERTHVSIQDPTASFEETKDLGLPMGTGPEYETITTVVLEHLRVSLIPEEKSNLHRSLQSLKLLAVLLSQSRAPLRATLLRTVFGSLEALVLTGHAQLTMPLMDVLLSAYSTSEFDDAGADMTVSRLLSTMLSTDRLPDLIHVAASIIRRGLCGSVHTAKAMGILLLPLDIVTGQALLNKHNAVSETQRSSVENMLNTKTSCISILCVCLTYTPQITLMPADFLTSAPVSLITSVLSLLTICSGHAPSSLGSSKACRNLIGCVKVQRCGLEALAALSSLPRAEEKLNEVFMVLLQYLQNPDSDPTVLQKCYQALVKWLKVCSDTPSMADQLRQDLLPVVKKRVCDVRWEVRDSTLEFLGQLPGVCTHEGSAQASCALEAVLDCSTTKLLTEALCDPESYVRATAISALAETVAHSWQQWAALPQQQADVVSRLLDILSEDTEGFPRRAVVRFFLTWFSTSSSSSSSLPVPSSCSSLSSSLLMTSVCSVLLHGSSDLDWEVKVHTLELAQLLLEESLPGRQESSVGADTHPTTAPTNLSDVTHPYALVSHQTSQPHTHIQTDTQTQGQMHAEKVNGNERSNGRQTDKSSVLFRLVEQGVISALFSGLFDYDRPVALKACHLLITLRDAVCPVFGGVLDTSLDPTAVAKVSCELQGWGWGREIRKCLKKRYDWSKEEAHSLSDRSDVVQEPDRLDEIYSGECDRMKEEGMVEEDGSVHVSVCEVLWSLGLEERLKVLSQSSDYVQNSPLSLLQDILTSTETHTHSHTHPDQEEVIIDCY